MNNNNNLYTFLGLVVVAAAVVGVVYFWPDTVQSPQNNNGNNNGQNQANVTDFESCAEAGFPIQESFPRQCRTTDGRTFTEVVEEESSEVVVTTPKRGDLVTSPLVVSGKARGFWYFEANLPVTLKDQNGKILAQKGFQAQGEWMTNDFVNFSDTLPFTSTTEFGTLIIQKDNPSGLPENDKEVSIPVRFR